MQLSPFLFKCAILTITFLAICIGVEAQATSGNIIHEVPLVIVYGGTLLLTIGSIRIGFWLGSTKKSILASSHSTTVDSVTKALMGLLAFLLAFTFDQSMDRFAERRELYIEKVNALEIAHRRADYLPERYKTVIQTELVKLVDLRLAVIHHPERIVDMVRQSNEIHMVLLKTLKQMANDTQVDVASLFNTSNAIMNLISVHNKRTTVSLTYHLPGQMWLALYALVMIAMVGMGHLFALSPKINWTLAIILSVSFSTVIMLITDLDRSGSHKSIIEFDQGAMVDLKERLMNPNI